MAGSDFGKILKRNIVLLYYILQILFIVLYSNPEVQPFVYVRF